MTARTKRTRVEVEEVEDDVPVKTAKRKVAALIDTVEASAKEVFNNVREAELGALITELNTLVKVNSISLTSEDRVSTGLLCLNTLMGGGIAPGMYTFLGPEQSGKTTAAITILGASIGENVDLRVLWDAENSTGSSIDYVTNVFNTSGVKATVDQIFEGDNTAGKLPLVVYRDDYEGDKFFKWVHGLQKRLPDKRFEDDAWWFVYDEDAKVKERIKDRIDKRMTAKQEAGLWVKADDGRLQAIVLIDSYPSLVPSKMDEDDGDNSIAIQARMFAKHLPRIKGALRAKRIAIVGINQLRINPMARFGNPEVEPGGEALKFFSDVRLRFFPRALSGAPYNPKGEGQLETEPSVTVAGGVDTYRYVHVGPKKNKLSPPGRQAWLRVWITDGNNEAQGFDPVFDTYHYLVQTGQANAKRSAIRLNVASLGEATKVLNWQEFKTLILGTKQQRAPLFEKIGYKNIDLRKGCFSQIKRGKSEEMYTEQSKALLKNKKSDDEED